MKQLVLASASPYRARQLQTLGLDFDACPADVDETPLTDECASALTTRLARLKARTAAAKTSKAVIIGCDQVAELDGNVIGKPGNADNARSQLQRASGREIRFFTGLCVLDPGNDSPDLHVDVTTVKFRTLQDTEIDRYIKAEQAFDCAGSFKCEGLGISLFDAIETRDPSALIGLPLIALARMLRDCGYSIP